MKQYAVLFLLLFTGLGGSLVVTPAVGVCIYYFFAVLRPQFLWKFQMSAYPAFKDITWSFYLAAAVIGSYLLWSIGLLSYGKAEKSVMRYAPAFTWTHRSMILFAIWITGSYIFSIDRNRSEEWYGEYLKIFVMYFISTRVLRTPNQVWALFLLTAFALAYIAFDANTQYLQSNRVVLYKRGFAMLDNNGAGLLLALGAPLCFFAWEMTRGWYRWLWLFGVVNIVHAVLTTYSRGAMISMIAPVIHYAFFIICFSSTYLKGIIKTVIFGILMVIGVWQMAGKEIVERFTSIENREMDASFQSRRISWRIAWAIANDNPVFGVGVRCSALEMLKRGADMEGRTIHSQYWQIAADSGWVALACYVLMIGMTFGSIWQARWRLWNRKDPDGIRAIAILNGVECSLITFLVGASALSLEVFEPSYLLLLLAAQIWALLNAHDTARGRPQMQSQAVARREGPPREPPPRPASRRGPATGKHPFARFQQPTQQR